MSQVELQFLGVNSNLLDYPTDSFKIVSAGKYVGSCSIADAIRTSDYYAKVADDIAPIGDRDSWFSYIRIEDEYIGQGLGMATYRATIDQAHGRGMRFRTDPECVSPSAMRVWS